MEIRILVSILLVSFASEMSSQKEPINPEFMFDCFAQNTSDNSPGNCASIATIKAAICTFGIDQVFESEITGLGFNIKLKNGETLVVTQKEYDEAAKSAKFILKKEKDNDGRGIDFNQRVYEYSILCYAVIAKMRLIHDEEIQSYEEALSVMSTGAYTPTVYLYLGLKGYMREYSWWTHGKDIHSGISWRSGHAVFLSKGYVDINGTKVKLGSLIRLHGRRELVTDISLGNCPDECLPQK